MTNKELRTFDSTRFLDDLLNEGCKTPLTTPKTRVLPPFYDDQKYKRGQLIFTQNIFAMLYCKFLGLISVLAIPSIVRVLISTNMSSTSMTAYRRYLATVFHVCVWYKEDFSPSSKIWESISDVRNKHNSASNRCCNKGLEKITQADMALTQFGFMGFAVLKKEQAGLHNIEKEDWEAFVHIWRVVGHLMGIEERFNICRESLEETEQICKDLAEKVFRPALAKKESDFTTMAGYLTQGMWSMNPTLNATIYINLAYDLMAQAENNNLVSKDFLLPMIKIQILWYYFIIFTLWTLQFSPLKIFHNYTQYISLWLMKVFPFLAYYQFGYANSHVQLSFSNVKEQ